jgi:hypothetical protein
MSNEELRNTIDFIPLPLSLPPGEGNQIQAAGRLVNNDLKI